MWSRFGCPRFTPCTPPGPSATVPSARPAPACAPHFAKTCRRLRIIARMPAPVVDAGG